MDLKDYIALHFDGNQQTFADHALIDKGTVSRVCNKLTRPNRSTVERITKATGGKVKWSDMLAPEAIGDV